MPCIEYVRFPASDAYIQDKSIAKPLFDLVSLQEGFTSVHCGQLHEDSRIGIFSVVWETYEQRKKFMDGPDYYKTKTLAAPCLSSTSHEKAQMKHITTTVDSTAALTAPITEVMQLRAKAGDVKEALKNIHEYVEALSITNGIYPPPSWGEVIEDPGEHYIIVGCKSVEVHAGERKLQVVLDKLKDTFNLNVEHFTSSGVDG